MRSTPSRQVRARNSETGSEMAAIRTHASMFSMVGFSLCFSIYAWLLVGRARAGGGGGGLGDERDRSDRRDGEEQRGLVGAVAVELYLVADRDQLKELLDVGVAETDAAVRGVLADRTRHVGAVE